MRHVSQVLSRGSLSSAIKCLLGAVCPPTILRTVIAVIVDSFQRESRRTFTHVSCENLKRKPLLAHGNTSLSVVNISGMIGVTATRPHVFPDTVERMFSSGYCRAVLAATKGVGTVFQFISSYGLDRATNTSTNPMRFCGVWLPIQCSPSPKLIIRFNSICAILGFSQLRYLLNRYV